MKRLQWLVSVLLVVCAGGVLADEVRIENGPWAARAGDANLLELTWQGETIVRHGNVKGFLPEWTGGRFPTTEPVRDVEGNTVTWTMTEARNQDATVTLNVGEDAVRYALDTTVHAQGPTEFWVDIAPEAVFAGDRVVAHVDGDLRWLEADQQFETITGARELRFETPDRTITVRSSGFQLQDRRDRGQGLFLVSVIGHSNDEAQQAERWVEIEVSAVPEYELATRQSWLEQTPTEISEVPVANPGFEADAPFEGWSASPLAAPDAGVTHGGERSARLTIDGPVEQAGQVYITQQVPVTPGHRYRAEVWIRGEDVRPLEQGGMSGVGATAILEFSRPDRTWLAPGSYADSQFGTFGWRELQTDARKAPEGAGYAVIFLALRGTGTAWFDDVRVEQVTHHPVLLEPQDGAEVRDNTPSLRWYFPQSAQATVELSQDPGFTDGAARRVDSMQSSARVDEPIEPGQWHWRVRVPEYDATSAVWSFQQTSSLDEDTTEPEIARSHDWLATPTAPMRVGYSDNVGVAHVQMVVDGRDVSTRVEMGEEIATYTPEEPWTDGLHVAEVRAEDAAGNAAEATVFFTAGHPDQRIVWEEHGGLSFDGEKRFLLGMYGINEEHMPEMARAGYDFVHSYRWDGSGDTESALAYLDEAHRHGLQAFMGINRQRLQAHDERFVAERVAALMRHPGLMAWYLYDEPDLEHQYVSPEWLERFYHLIGALDPFHPVIVTCAGDGAVPRYRDTLDVHWTQVYGDTARVANRLDLHRGMLREGTPLAAILHCYDRKQRSLMEAGETPDPAKFEPDGRMMRANAFMAIAHNSSGLSWWWWGYGGSDRFFTVAQVPEAWESLQETVARIKELEPVLTADGEIVTRVLEPAEDVEVHLWEKRLADRVVTIAVNRDDQAVEASWQPEWAQENGTMSVRWEGREVAITGGQITDAFEPRGVHVYER